MRKDFNCSWSQRNVPCTSDIFSSLSLHASQNSCTISLIAFFNCKTTLYPAAEKHKFSTLDTWELPAFILFNCLFSWYDFARNLGGLYGVSILQTLALDFAVFSLLTLLQFLFHTSTLFCASSFSTQQASFEKNEWVTCGRPSFSECTAG